MAASSGSFRICGRLVIIDGKVMIFKIDDGGRVPDCPVDLMEMIEAAIKRDIGNGLLSDNVLILTERTVENIDFLNANPHYANFFASLSDDSKK